MHSQTGSVGRRIPPDSSAVNRSESELAAPGPPQVLTRGSCCPQCPACPAKGTRLLLLNQQHPLPFSSPLHSSFHSPGYTSCTIYYIASIKVTALRAGHGIWSDLEKNKERGKYWAREESPASKAHEKALGPAPSVPSVLRREAQTCPHREDRPLERALWKCHWNFYRGELASSVRAIPARWADGPIVQGTAHRPWTQPLLGS